MAWKYGHQRRKGKPWQCEYIDFEKSEDIRLRPGAPPRPKGLYYARLQPGKQLVNVTVSRLRQRFGTIGLPCRCNFRHHTIVRNQIKVRGIVISLAHGYHLIPVFKCKLHFGLDFQKPTETIFINGSGEGINASPANFVILLMQQSIYVLSF
jgi:hypothetical protein